MVKLFEFQEEAIKRTANFNRVAYYFDMGLGKTFVGGEKLMSFDNTVNLVVCQKSKIDDWIKHFERNYENVQVFNLTKTVDYQKFLGILNFPYYGKFIGVINYDLVFRRPELLTLKDFGLLLDESSMIKNEKAKRTKAILRMKTDHVVLLSGTPVGGKYEELWSQCKLLGWDISKSAFWARYIVYRDWYPVPGMPPIKLVTGYKNVCDLKLNLKLHGAVFLKTNEVIDLPEQMFQTVSVPANPQYRKMMKTGVAVADGVELVGDTPLTRLLYARQLCSIYSKEKFTAFEDLLNSNNTRLVVFYNFTAEYDKLRSIAEKNNRPVSVINGQTKDLKAYENEENTVVFCQYQAAALGINLQLANHLIYFSLPLSSELYEQSKKRVHRIGQSKTCFYYILSCEGSVEEQILDTLNKRNNYTLELFKGDFK